MTSPNEDTVIRDFDPQQTPSIVNISLVSEGQPASNIRVNSAQKSNQISQINSSSVNQSTHRLKNSLSNLNLNNVAASAAPFDSQATPHKEGGMSSRAMSNHLPSGEIQNNILTSRSIVIPPNSRNSLSTIMNGKSPKDFARQMVYGNESVKKSTSRPAGGAPSALTTSQTAQFAAHLAMSREQNSVNTDSIPSETAPPISNQQPQLQQQQQFQTPHQYRSITPPPISPSKFTVLSQALLADVLHTNRSHHGTTLLSDDKLYEVQKSQKKQPTLETSRKEKEIIERLFYDQSSQLEKDRARQAHEELIMSQCTFSPRQYFRGGNFSSHESQRGPRRTDEFYQNQLKLQSLSQAHLSELQQAQQQGKKHEILEKPQLSKRTKEINQSQERQGKVTPNVVDRLFQEKKDNSSLQQQFSHMPSISSHANQKQRPQRIDVFLYEDAKRRNDQAKSTGSLTDRQTSRQEQSSSRSSVSPISKASKKTQDKAITAKLDKEFQEAVANMAFIRNPNRDSLPELISYLETAEILAHLGYVNPKSLSDDHSNSNNHLTAQEIQRVWGQLSAAHQTNKVLVRNLEVFLFALNKINAESTLIPFVTAEQIKHDQRSQQLAPDRENHSSKHSSKQLNSRKDDNQLVEVTPPPNSKEPIGSFDENDNLYYSNEQVVIISKMFKDLYDNRMANQNKVTKARASKSQHAASVSTPQFTPLISNYTRRLAQEKREKVVQELKSNEGFDGNEVDMNEILRYQQQLSRFQSEEKKLRREEDKLSECTFHPQTKDFRLVEKIFSPRSQQNMFEQEMSGKSMPERSRHVALGIHRTVELYSLAKPHKQRRDREKSEIEYERECDECTFSPDISHITLFKGSNIGGSQSPKNLDSIITKSQQQQHQQIQQQQQQQHHQRLANSPQNTRAVQKVIDRMSNARLSSKIQESLSQQGTTVSQTKRSKQTKNTKHEISCTKHQHLRPEGRFLSQHNHSHQQRVVNSSPRPVLLTSQEQTDQSSLIAPQSIDVAQRSPSGGSTPNQGDIEYYLKQPQQDIGFKLPSAASKTMEEERVPLLFVDVNIEDGKTARIIVYEGEKSEDLALKFAQEHNLDAVMTGRLKDLLDQQINSLLTKIDEEVGSDHEDEQDSIQGDDQDDSRGVKRNRKGQQNTDTFGQDGGAFTDENSHSARQLNNIGDNGGESQFSPNNDNSNNNNNNNNHQSDSNSKSPQNIMDMHMRALAMTFKNYSESEAKQSQLPSAGLESQQQHTPQSQIQLSNQSLNTPTPNEIEPTQLFRERENSSPLKDSTTSPRKSAVTPKDIQDLHMRALAQTFQNYSSNMDKYNALPVANDLPKSTVHVLDDNINTKYTSIPQQQPSYSTTTYETTYTKTLPQVNQQYAQQDSSPITSSYVLNNNNNNNNFTLPYSLPKQNDYTYTTSSAYSAPLYGTTSNYLSRQFESNPTAEPAQYVPLTYQQQPASSYVPSTSSYVLPQTNVATPSYTSYTNQQQQYGITPITSTSNLLKQSQGLAAPTNIYSSTIPTSSAAATATLSTTTTTAPYNYISQYSSSITPPPPPPPPSAAGTTTITTNYIPSTTSYTPLTSQYASNQVPTYTAQTSYGQPASSLPTTTPSIVPAATTTTTTTYGGYDQSYTPFAYNKQPQTANSSSSNLPSSNYVGNTTNFGSSQLYATPSGAGGYGYTSNTYAPLNTADAYDATKKSTSYSPISSYY